MELYNCKFLQGRAETQTTRIPICILYLENMLLLISINFTPKTATVALKNGTLWFAGICLRLVLVDFCLQI